MLDEETTGLSITVTDEDERPPIIIISTVEELVGFGLGLLLSLLLIKAEVLLGSLRLTQIPVTVQNSSRLLIHGVLVMGQRLLLMNRLERLNPLR